MSAAQALTGEDRRPVLEVRDLRVQFCTPLGVVNAVDGVSYELRENEIVGIVGESGCGKSATQLAVMQLLQSPPGRVAGGEVIFEEKDLLKYKRNGPEMRAIRGGQIAMIFQEPIKFAQSGDDRRSAACRGLRTALRPEGSDEHAGGS